MAFSEGGDYQYGETYDPNKPRIRPVTGTQYDYKPNAGGIQDPNQDFQIGYADPSQQPLPETPQTPQSPTAPATSAGPVNGDYQGWFNQLIAGKAPTPDVLKSLEPQLVAAGFKLRPNAAGVVGKIETPNGQVIDVIQGAGAGGQAWQWLTGPGGGPGGGGGGFGSAAYVPGQGVPGQGTIFGGGGVTGSAEGNKLFEMLMGRAQQGVDLDPNDPVISRQVDAYNATQQHTQRDYEKALAERKGATGNMTAERRLGAERVGQATSGFEATLMQRERDARRQEIQQALSGSMGLLTQSQQLQLQEELAQLSLSQNAYQFDSNDQFRNSPLGS